MRTLIVLLCLGCACKQTSKEQPAAADAPRAPAVDAAPAAKLRPRPGGPTVEECQKAADHLASLIIDSAVGASNEERGYVEKLLAQRNTLTLAICVEVAVPREVECMQAAKDFMSLASCERFRREVPKDLLSHAEPTQADCERLFDRLRQFRIEEGTDPDEVETTRDQVVRACQEKAKIGTVACFIASPTYAQARSCP
jgi:hypothetical protein